MNESIQKVGSCAILTLNGYVNYGNRLQNYALQQIVLQYAQKVDTLIIEQVEQKSGKSKIDSIQKKPFLVISNLKRLLLNTPSKTIKAICTYKRMIKFEQFSKEFLYERQTGLSPSNIPNGIAEWYDFFIVGSDQVWNPTFQEFSELFFLTFVPERKRIAYAPSFGIADIPVKFHLSLQKWLNSIPNISVREDSGAEIIRQFTNKDVPVLLDPTLLMDATQWVAISKPVRNIPKQKFILVYFLGEVGKKRMQEIKKYARLNNYSVVVLNSLRHPRYYSASPSEFITLIRRSSLICTDSFHGTAFSIIFNKPFVVYDRKGQHSMSSRIETILQTFHLEIRRAMKLTDASLLKIDYKIVSKILDVERKRSLSFLKNSFT